MRIQPNIFNLSVDVALPKDNLLFTFRSSRLVPVHRSRLSQDRPLAQQ